MTEHTHTFSSNVGGPGRFCSWCHMPEFGQQRVHELEARVEKAEAEVERLFKAAWKARELMNLNDPEYAILSKALEPKT